MVTRWRHWNAHAAFLWRRWARQGYGPSRRGKGGKTWPCMRLETMMLLGSFVLSSTSSFLVLATSRALWPSRHLANWLWPRSDKLSCAILCCRVPFSHTPNMLRARHRPKRQTALANLAKKVGNSAHRKPTTKDGQIESSSCMHSALGRPPLFARVALRPWGKSGPLGATV